MTHVVVDPGICGMPADIKVEMVDRRNCKITIDTKCTMISDLVEGLGESVNVFDLLGMSRNGNLLEQSREGTRIHGACPTIAGIAKAAEAAAELALPRNASITFVDD